MAFNLKKIAMEAETAFIHLTEPSGEKLMDGDKKVGVNVYSPATTQHRNALRRWAKFSAKPESDEKDAAKIDYLCAITHSWNNIDFEGLSGADLSRKIYSDATLQFIHQQIDRECLMQANIEAVRAGFVSPQDIAAQGGGDYSDNIAAIAEAAQIALAAGITLGAGWGRRKARFD